MTSHDLPKSLSGLEEALEVAKRANSEEVNFQ